MCFLIKIVFKWFSVEIKAKENEISNEMFVNYTHERNKNSRTSIISKTWDLVYDSDGIEVVGFYYCTKCHKVQYSKHAPKGSTSQLLRHGCVPKDDEQKSFVISESDHEAINLAATKFVAMDLRPLRAVECPGLLELVWCGVELGKKYPDMTFEDLKREFPTRNTIRNTLIIEGAQSKAVIGQLLKKAIENGGFGCTLDLWSE